MRFPFFTQRKKPSSLKDAAKAKMSRMCCLHAPTEVTNGVQERETSFQEDSSRIMTKTDQFGNKPIVARPLKCTPSQNSTTSSTSSISPLEAVVSDPRDRAESRQSTNLREFCEQFGFSASPDVATGDGSVLGASSMGSYSPSQTSSTGWSVRREPGLGSVADNPPSRMAMEPSTPDINSLKLPRRIARRGDVSGAAAPDLPTRLEVYSGTTRNEEPALFDSVVSMHSEKLDCHPLKEAVSPGGSTGTEGSNQSPVKDNRMQGVAYRAQNEHKMRTLSNSPVPPQSRDSTSKVTSLERLTKLKAQTESEIRKFVSQNVNESATRQLQLQQRQKHFGKQEEVPKLRQWNVCLKLDWVSQFSDDLVAEVYPLHQQSPSSTAVRNKPSSIPGIRNNSREHQSEIQPCPVEEEEEVSVESEIAQIVDRVLCELKNSRKRKTKNKPVAKGRRYSQEIQTVEVIEDPRFEQQYFTRLPDRNRQLEFDKHHSTHSVQFQRRTEVLRAFELLVYRMEDRMYISNSTEESGDVPLEKRLSEAILFDLRREIVRLTDRLYSLKMAKQEESFGKAPLTQLPSEPRTHQQATSFQKPKASAASGIFERSHSNGGRRPHSALATTNQRMLTLNSEQGLVLGSAPPNYLHSSTKKQSHLGKNKGSRKSGSSKNTNQDDAVRRRGRLNLTFK
eukprot:g8603.t1